MKRLFTGAGQDPGHVLVVGSVNIDLVTRVSAFPQPGETLLGSDYETHHGGKGANQAVAAARLNAQVRFVGRVGSDGFGPTLKQALADEGIDVTSLSTVSAPSGAAFITVDEQGQNTIIVSPGANSRLTPRSLTSELFEGAAVVLLQLEIPPETVRQAIWLARAAGARVIVNAAPAWALGLDGLSGTDLLIVNESEAHSLLGQGGKTGDAGTALSELAARIPEVVITLGSGGVIWQTADSAGHLPAFSVTAVDTTAAGDAFVGGLAAGLARDESLNRAIRIGCAAGALAVTRHGAQPSLPHIDDVTRLLEGSSRAEHPARRNSD
ncbi:MAG: ribokinase [Trueperaceae bacterium]